MGSPPFIGSLCGDHSPYRTTMTQTKCCPILHFGLWWLHLPVSTIPLDFLWYSVAWCFQAFGSTAGGTSRTGGPLSLLLQVAFQKGPRDEKQKILRYAHRQEAHGGTARVTRSSAFNSSTNWWVFQLLHRDKPHSAYSPEDQRFHSAVIDVDGCSPCFGSTTSVGNGPGSAEDSLEVQQEQCSRDWCHRSGSSQEESEHEELKEIERSELKEIEGSEQLDGQQLKIEGSFQ